MCFRIEEKKRLQHQISKGFNSVIVDKVADIVKSEDYSAKLEPFLNEYGDINQTDEKGGTLLHYFAR